MSKSIRQFVQDYLFGPALATETPRTLNVSDRYISFLKTELSHGGAHAAERAEQDASLITECVQEQIGTWWSLGVPSPVNFGNSTNVLITWAHPKHDRLTGRETVNSSFVQHWLWLGSLGSTHFMAAAACYLWLAGCDPIYITEGPYDGGVDCIGRISDGPLRSVVIFVQAKTAQNARIKTRTLYEEYGKFAALHKEDLYRRYLAALGVPEQKDGVSVVYLMLTNSEFTFEARSVADSIGMVLRSRRQIAHWLAPMFSREGLRLLIDQERVPEKKNLYNNVSSTILSVYQKQTRHSEFY